MALIDDTIALRSNVVSFVVNDSLNGSIHDDVID